MRILLWVALVGMAAMTAYSVLAPDAASFKEPSLARIVFFHLPCALLTIVMLPIAAYQGFRFLRHGDLKWDVRLGASTEIAALLALLTMVTGILFSRTQWGAWWHWDPRQTSFLMVLMLLGAAVALRAGLTDEVKRARASSAYALVTLLPNIFMIYVFPRLPQVKEMSLHPTTTIQEGQFDVWYHAGVWGGFLMLGLLVALVYQLRVRAGLLELRLDNLDGMDQSRGGDPAAARLRRPVAVPAERGEAAD